MTIHAYLDLLARQMSPHDNITVLCRAMNTVGPCQGSCPGTETHAARLTALHALQQFPSGNCRLSENKQRKVYAFQQS